jgi:predicted phage-related endonuclease
MSHAARPWQKATTDKGIAQGKMGQGGIEAKTALSFYSGKAYLDGKIPQHHRAQCLHYMAVTGSQFWILAALTEGPRFYTHIIERDEAEIEWLIEKETELWNAIQTDNIEFLVDGTDKTARAIAKLYGEVEPSPEPAVITDVKAIEAVQQYLTSKSFEKAAQADKKEAENIIKAALGPCELAYIGEALVKWSKTKSGRRFTVKEEKRDAT